MVGWLSAAAGAVVALLALGRRESPVALPQPPPIQIVEQPTEVTAARSTGRAAIIGAGVGATVSAVAAIVTAVIQGTSQGDQARTDFIRQQEQAAYAALVSNHTSYANAEESYYYGIAMPSMFNRDIAGNLQSSRQKFIDSYGLVQLVGSPEAVKAATDLAGAHEHWQNNLISYIGTIPPTTPLERSRTESGQEATRSAREALFQATEEEGRTIKSFKSQARRDIGSEPN
jgi:hypothetical protein